MTPSWLIVTVVVAALAAPDTGVVAAPDTGVVAALAAPDTGVVAAPDTGVVAALAAPDTGVVAAPDTGVVAAPDTGVVAALAAPDTGVVAAPDTGVVAAPGAPAAQEQEWWQTEIFYQIYPRSFKDSNGDGTGDLEGVRSKLEHFNDLGVGAVWLSPIFTSPMADFGYDIADFRDIDPIFGTMADFDALLERAKELNIKIILDLVPNHSSDEHDWFIRSKKSEDKYKDYYVWMDPIGTDTVTGAPVPPNQWIGAFHESVWEYDEERKQFYYHRYNVKQPDLNFDNPDVRKEMEDIIRFWLDKGVDGFRVDSIITLVEAGFPNVDNSENDKYTINQPLTYEIVQDWRKILDEYQARDNSSKVMMTEAYGALEDTNGYYGNETNRGAHFTFNFNFISNLSSNSNAHDVVDTIQAWIDDMPSFATANWVIGNHDNHRAASKFGNELAAGMAMLTLLLPGIGVIYNGEEIGMVNNWDISYDDTLDPAGVNAGPDEYREFSRDFERTPFQWDDSKNAGFSSGDTTWLPVHKNYKELNLKQEKVQEESYWKIYRSLISARQTETILHGDLKVTPASDNVVAMWRSLEGEASYMVIVNVGDDLETVDLSQTFSVTLDRLNVYTSSLGSNHPAGSVVSANSLRLGPKTSVVLTDATVAPPTGTASATYQNSAALLLAAVMVAVRSAFY